MAKRESKSGEVRYTGIMDEKDRNRFKAFCALRGLQMERLGPQWIMDRLEEEERKARR